MARKHFSLVIFDCDGVLVDSEAITNRVFAGMINELGVPVTLDDMFEKFVGRTTVQCVETITQLLGRDIPGDFIRRYQERSAAALTEELRAIPGIEAALEAIELPYCVASNGTQEKMRTTLGLTGLLPRFEGKMFSVSEVAAGKPAPDIFLLAARTMGASPDECVVVEDTPTGVIAGVAAGMTVFGYCAQTPKARLLEAGAHLTFSDMHALPSLLA